jgi:hypothetical protein
MFAPRVGASARPAEKQGTAQVLPDCVRVDRASL